MTTASATEHLPESSLAPTTSDVPTTTENSPAETDVTSKKRSPPQEGANSDDTTKRVRSEKEDPSTESDQVIVDGTASTKLEALRKQVEYYFSDANMRRDHFFHSKITADPENWLDLKFVLSCRKIKDLGATQEDIISALIQSDIETKVDEHGSGWVRRTTPLPPLDPDVADGKGRRNGKNAGPKRSPSCPTTTDDIHALGCFLKITGIPEEVSWVPVKKALQDCLPNDGKLRHVSTVSSDGVAYVYCRKFPNDVEALKNIKSINVNNVDVNVHLVDEISTAAHIIDNHLPKNILRDREKEAAKLKAERTSKPLMLGGTRFESVDHLRKCYKELLQLAVLEENLKPLPFQVIRALLDYHPNAAQKTRDIVSIKVAERSDIQIKPGDKPSRCFFVVRSDGTCEDVSMVKCIEGLIRNPPYCVEESNPTTDEPSVATTPTVTADAS